MEDIYDVIIIGEGVAGMTAGIYSARAGARTLILEKNVVGGQASLTYAVENYPGFKSISGIELVMAMQKQVHALGVEVRYAKVQAIEDGKIKTIKTKDKTYKTKALILCLGAVPRKLGLPNEDEFNGKGVSYCAVCDGAFFRGKPVAVIGGGNTALEDANYLAQIASKVYLLVRKNTLKAQNILVEALNKNVQQGKIEVLYNTEVAEICGTGKVDYIIAKNNQTQTTQNIKVDGLFVAIGRSADTDLVANIVERDEWGYIVVNAERETSAKGIFSAGDCTNTTLRQIITACADGAISATSAVNYANHLK